MCVALLVATTLTMMLALLLKDLSAAQMSSLLQRQVESEGSVWRPSWLRSRERAWSGSKRSLFDLFLDLVR